MSAQYTIIFRLSVGNKYDAPEGRKLVESFYSEHNHYLLMDRTYEDNEIQKLDVKQGFISVVPPKSNRRKRESTTKSFTNVVTGVELYFLRINCFSRVFTRYDKLDLL